MLEKALIDQLLRKIKKGSLSVNYWDGSSQSYGKHDKPELTLTLHDKKIVRSLVKNPSLGAGEAYMDGRLTVDGPLDKLAELAFLNKHVFDMAKANRMYKGITRNIKRNQRKLIAHHYDLGNDFYKLWLDDKTLGYTCSYYKTPDDSLEEGQIQKFDHVLNKLQIHPGQELLDIGFGWGYLLIRAAKRFGTKGFGVSLSQEQLGHAREWAKKEKVDHLVSFELMNYQDLPKLKRQFDRVVSVGFFEHVGRGNHPTYFDIVNKMLKPDGVSVLHCITSQYSGPSDAWLDKYIFPGYAVLTIAELSAMMAERGFVQKDYENIGPHYAKTLDQWWENVRAHKKDIVAMYDERFYKMWEFYLASCMAAFRVGTLNLSQWTFTRSPCLQWPLTRDYLYTNKKDKVI